MLQYSLSPSYQAARLLVISETKLDNEFLTAQFKIENYEIKNRKDQDKHGGGIIEYVKKGIVCRQIK